MTATALVTGASSGIGLDLARVHAARGGDLVLVARRQDRLEELAARLHGQHGVSAVVLPCDLSRPGAAEIVHREVGERGITIDYLINNAGFGGHGLFHDIDPDRHEAMIQVNVLALTRLTRAFLPEMIARRSGRVLNVASTAAFIPGPLQAVYFATKAYVLSFTEALAVELKGTGVTVTALCPGATATGFGAAADLEGARLFARGAATSAHVAEAGYRAMIDGRTVYVQGARNKPIPLLARLLPRRLLATVAMKAMEKP